jgi:hypothetical protein
MKSPNSSGFEKCEEWAELSLSSQHSGGDVSDLV